MMILTCSFCLFKLRFYLNQAFFNLNQAFTPTKTVLNLSGIQLKEEELGVLKYGLKHPIETRLINKTDVLTTFDFIHRAMNKDLKDNRDAGEVKTKLSYLANSYVNIYKPTKTFYGNIEF